MTHKEVSSSRRSRGYYDGDHDHDEDVAGGPKSNIETVCVQETLALHSCLEQDMNNDTALINDCIFCVLPLQLSSPSSTTTSSSVESSSVELFIHYEDASCDSLATQICPILVNDCPCDLTGRGMCQDVLVAYQRCFVSAILEQVRQIESSSSSSTRIPKHPTCQSLNCDSFSMATTMSDFDDDNNNNKQHEFDNGHEDIGENDSSEEYIPTGDDESDVHDENNYDSNDDQDSSSDYDSDSDSDSPCAEQAAEAEACLMEDLNHDTDAILDCWYCIFVPEGTSPDSPILSTVLLDKDDDSLEENVANNGRRITTRSASSRASSTTTSSSISCSDLQTSLCPLLVQHNVCPCGSGTCHEKLQLYGECLVDQILEELQQVLLQAQKRQRPSERGGGIRGGGRRAIPTSATFMERLDDCPLEPVSCMINTDVMITDGRRDASTRRNTDSSISSSPSLASASAMLPLPLTRNAHSGFALATILAIAFVAVAIAVDLL